MTEQIPVAVWEGSFNLFGVDLRCYVLDDGRRIINADDLAAVYDGDRAGAALDDSQHTAFIAWLKGGSP